MSGHDTYQPQNAFMKWMERRLPIAGPVPSPLVGYPRPRNQSHLFSGIPGAGGAVATWLWGGLAGGNPTLQRFYSLPYLLPFVMGGVVVLPIWARHVVGQINPTGIEPKAERDTVSFTPYATI